MAQGGIRDGERAMRQAKSVIAQFAIYSALCVWAFICLFPIYWTFTTTFKTAPDVTQGISFRLSISRVVEGIAVSRIFSQHDF